MENYEVLDLIGKGNFGSISKILRKSDDKILVWKELDYGRMSEKEKQNIVSEVNILRDLHHPNIVRYYDRIVDKKNTKIYIIMEYCEGGDIGLLIKRLKKNKELIPEEIIWKIFTQLVLALYECHNHKDGKILHRDIKPSNVFLDAENNIKLGDFGLSRMLSNESYFAYSHVGTPYYMSPEQIEEVKYNEKSDIWSLGCFLYEVATFNPPFEATNQLSLALKIKAGKVEPIPNKYSSELSKVIMWMLNVDQNKRPSVDELMNYPSVMIRIKERKLKEHYLKMKKMEEMIKEKESEIIKREEESKTKEKEIEERELKVLEREKKVEEKEKEIEKKEKEIEMILEREKQREIEREQKEKMLEEKDKLQEMILKKNNQSNNGMQKIYKDNYITNNNELDLLSHKQPNDYDNTYMQNIPNNIIRHSTKSVNPVLTSTPLQSKSKIDYIITHHKSYELGNTIKSTSNLQLKSNSSVLPQNQNPPIYPPQAFNYPTSEILPPNTTNMYQYGNYGTQIGVSNNIVHTNDSNIHYYLNNNTIPNSNVPNPTGLPQSYHPQKQTIITSKKKDVSSINNQNIINNYSIPSSSLITTSSSTPSSNNSVKNIIQKSITIKKSLKIPTK